jgi:hypothetical protein
MSSARPARIGGLCRALTVACLAVSIVASPGAATGAEAPHGPEYSCRLVVTKLGREITLTFRLRTDSAGDAWRVRLFHDDELIFSKLRVTNAEGDLKVVRVAPNLAGIDAFEGRARHLESGTICEVESRI